MKSKQEEKSLINTHNGLFNKVIYLLRKFFHKQRYNDIQENIQETNNKNKFKEQIQIEKSAYDEEMLIIQQEFKQGTIDENDIKEEDYIELIRLYDTQNEKLKQEIEMYKIKTANLLKQMNN